MVVSNVRLFSPSRLGRDFKIGNNRRGTGERNAHTSQTKHLLLHTDLIRLIALTTCVREPYLFKPNASRDREENTMTPTRVSRADSGKKLTKDLTKSMTLRKFLRPTLLEPSIRIPRSTRDLQTGSKNMESLLNGTNFTLRALLRKIANQSHVAIQSHDPVIVVLLESTERSLDDFDKCLKTCQNLWLLAGN